MARLVSGERCVGYCAQHTNIAAPGPEECTVGGARECCPIALATVRYAQAARRFSCTFVAPVRLPITSTVSIPTANAKCTVSAMCERTCHAERNDVEEACVRAVPDQEADAAASHVAAHLKK